MGVDPLAAVGRFALVVQQHEFDTARDHLLPRLVEAEPILSSERPELREAGGRSLRRYVVWIGCSSTVAARVNERVAGRPPESWSVP
jgi:hypothetical protein